MELSQEKKIQVLKKIFSEDIEEYAKFFFPNHLKKKTPDFHRDIFNLYQGKDKFIAIAAPRGHAKSTITDLVFLSWCLVHDKVRFALLISDTYSQATLFLESLKAELETNERLIMFYGTFKSDKWSESEIVTRGIMIKALGAGMSVRGLKYLDSRPDLAIVDDLENDELVQSLERREKLERWFNGALIPSMADNGRLVLIGTILHYDSLLYKLLSPTGYTEFVKRTYRAINGTQALWPEHLDIEQLEKIKANYIEKGLGFQFYQEYQNDPVSDENRKFKLEKFKYYIDNDLEKKTLNHYITIDRAYSTAKTADSTGIIVNGVTGDNQWFIRLAEAYKGNEKDLIDRIFDLVQFWKPLKIGIEQKAFQFTFKIALEDEMRRRNVFFVVEELKDQGQSKNLRIEGLVPRFENGSIFIKKEQTVLVDQLIQFPKAVHDDVSDALAYQLYLAQAPTLDIVKRKHYQPATKYGG